MCSSDLVSVVIWTRGSKYDRLTHRQAALLIESFHRFPGQEMTLMTLKLLRSALASTDGRDYGGVKVVNLLRKTRSRR